MSTPNPQPQPQPQPQFQQSAGGGQPGGGRTFVEWIEVAGSDLIATVKQLIADGNVRRIILRDATGAELFSIPMTAGAVVGGLAVLAAPVLAAVGAIAALVSKVTIEVVRTDQPAQQEGSAQQTPTWTPGQPEPPVTGEVMPKE
ncbi:DUF4342 domain-containing protein [Schaalia sp. 19OD2882]|uniref:DUF4342 domain-containing protein n=1 Tax=Schaalia sp. 19OD2882 TaxID=2794089 RepID=UPI001C1EC340|nr:DUF4342 domain-containing protein [Schaalia sp. 19OD2882]QWW19475.1 DUF4342 domain-containing protein [Schaalia sp. 19OD2882]